MKTHVKVWTGGPSLQLIDMTNAGKRGKKCRTIRASGWYTSKPDLKTTANWSGHMVHWAEHVDTSKSFDELAEELVGIACAAYADGVDPHYLRVHEVEEIRGIDAPKVKLVASGPGWSAQADENGIVINDDADQHNLPCEITHQQTNAAAYAIAAKVWDKVKQAKSFSEAGQILSGAGAKLHYYCRMD
jgi:hypothetical protein